MATAGDGKEVKANMGFFLERKFTEQLGSIFDVCGNYIGEGWANVYDPAKVLIKTPFTDFMEISEVTTLILQGYQFSSFPEPSRAVGGVAAVERIKDFSYDII